MASPKTMTVAGSPVTNGGTATATLQVVSGRPNVAILATFTKTSGTLGGTATLQGSLDGTTYVTVPTGATVAGASTYTVTGFNEYGCESNASALISTNVTFIELSRHSFKNFSNKFSVSGSILIL